MRDNEEEKKRRFIEASPSLGVSYKEDMIMEDFWTNPPRSSLLYNQFGRLWKWKIFPNKEKNIVIHPSLSFPFFFLWSFLLSFPSQLPNKEKKNYHLTFFSYFFFSLPFSLNSFHFLPPKQTLKQNWKPTTTPLVIKHVFFLIEPLSKNLLESN